MSDELESSDIVTAEVQPTKSISKVWFVPIVALFIGAWMVFYTWSNQGPLITIAFQTAESLELENTKIKLRDIVIGRVVDLKLNDDFSGIVVTARLNKDTESLLKTDTQFWVVKPRIGKGGISGLSTILSGTYIKLSPGLEDQSEEDFIGLESPPVTPAGTPGLAITLDSRGDRAFDLGDPILYRGIQVGQIEHVYFSHEKRVIYYNAFIESPYDKLITTNTRFWEMNGFEVSVTAEGIRAQTGTLETFIAGGISFDVPANLPRGDVISERAYFTIYQNKDELQFSKYKNGQNYVLLFNQSIRGLIPGAPVEYKGVRIGSVVRTDINYPSMKSLLDKNALIPVMVRIEPARMGLADDSGELEVVKADLSQWISKGLHGFISSGNLITGSKLIELKYIDQATTNEQRFDEYQLIPTAASELDRLFEKFGSFVNTLDELPLERLVSTADEALSGMSDAMTEFGSASSQFDKVLQSAESEALVVSVNRTLKGIEKLAADFSEGSKTHQDVQDAIASLDRVLRELAPLLSQLNRQPNSLIFGEGQKPEQQPTRKE